MFCISWLNDVITFMIMINVNVFVSLSVTGFFVPFIYLPDNTKALGYSPEQAAFLLSILGFTNTAGRIAAGWVSDR